MVVCHFVYTGMKRALFVLSCGVISKFVQIGVSFNPPEVLGFQDLYVDAETKFSKEPLHSFITTSIPRGEYINTIRAKASLKNLNYKIKCMRKR